MIEYFSIILHLINTVLTLTSKKYSIQVNTSIGQAVSSSWLIQSYKLKSKFDCLAQCNLRSDCFTLTYSLDLNENCVLFSRYFSTSELVS
jgi:mRNA-degrading endonuclease YafQ of YafQ-DinJ toxin-antitoxin module